MSNILDEVFHVIDVETTGLDPQKDKIVEIAVTRIHNGESRVSYSQKINPGITVPPEASAVHHLTDRDLVHSPSIESVQEALLSLLSEGTLVAHNAPFDRSFLSFLGDRAWICSMRLAKHLWPSAPVYGNQVLRYYLGLLDIQGFSTPHRSTDDTLVTAEIFLRELDSCYAIDIRDVPSLISFCDSPVTIDVMPFGKHKGVPLKNLPSDYVSWVMKNVSDLDPDLRWSLENRLSR